MKAGDDKKDISKRLMYEKERESENGRNKAPS